MKKIINWFLAKKLKWQKYKLLRVVKADLIFIEARRGELLNADLGVLRNSLATERKKENSSDERIYQLSLDVAKAEAVKREYEKLREMERDLPEYMSLL